MWGGAEIAQKASGLSMKPCQRGCDWLLPDPCRHVRSCQADLGPESWSLACGAGLVAPAMWSDPDTSSASLPCFFLAPTLQGAATGTGGASSGACFCINLLLLCSLYPEQHKHFSSLSSKHSESLQDTSYWKSRRPLQRRKQRLLFVLSYSVTTMASELA